MFKLSWYDKKTTKVGTRVDEKDEKNTHKYM